VGKTNRKIDLLLMSGDWAIERSFALMSLNQYLSEIALIESGATFSDLGFAEKRAKSLSSIISPSGAFQNVQVNDLENTEFGSIAHLKLSGVMRSEDGMSSRGVSSLVSDIYSANGNPAIKGIILEARTGGGESISGSILMSAIKDSKKPIIVLSHLLASAGIKGTLYADEIIASSKSAEFGSIGTYLSLDKEILEYYKENVTEIYSDDSPDKNKGFRDLLAGDANTIIKEITKADNRFMDEVRRARPLKGNIEKTLMGGMFPAMDAKRRGLIDRIGGMNLAIDRVNFYAELYKNKKRRK